jgi:hypothetical protein
MAGPWRYPGVIRVMALSPSRAYVATSSNVYLLDRGATSVYLTSVEAASSAGTDVSLGFRDLDIDPQGAIYAILGESIIRSNAAHTAAVWRADPNPSYDPSVCLGVVGVDDVALVNSSTLSRVSSNGVHVSFSNTPLIGYPCAFEHLATARSGWFLFQPGCNESPLERGNVDGSSFDILYTASLPGGPPLDAVQFLCSTRDAGGGFYVVVQDSTFRLRLYHLTEDANSTEGSTIISSSPSFADAQIAQLPQNDIGAFGSCQLSAASDGTIFFATSGQLWTLAPTL